MTPVCFNNNEISIIFKLSDESPPAILIGGTFGGECALCFGLKGRALFNNYESYQKCLLNYL